MLPSAARLNALRSRPQVAGGGLRWRRAAVPSPFVHGRARSAARLSVRATASATESTDLDIEAQHDPWDLGVYVYGPSTALHVGFQGPGWRLLPDRDTGYAETLDFCSPGRIRIAFGAASGVDDDGEAVYSWNRRGWGGGGHCLSNSLGDEKPRFYLTPRQGAEILAAPFREHSWDCKFLGWRGNEDGCPKIWDESEREGGIEMVKTLTWTPLTPANGNGAGPRFEVSLALRCSDGFTASARVELDGADWILFQEAVKFAIPHLLGLHGAFRLPRREDLDV